MDSNEDRAKRAEKLIKFYGNEHIRLSVIDALVDIRHLCDKLGIDYENAERTAQSHYNWERT